MSDITFARALIAAERVEGRIVGGPVVEISKAEMRRHYRRNKVSFDWAFDEPTSTLRIGYHANDSADPEA